MRRRRMGDIEPTTGGVFEDPQATEINRKYREVESLASSTVEAAIELGGMLEEKKAALQHGQWLPWVRAYFEGSERQAERYMQLYRGRDELRAKSTRVADLSLREALREIRPAPQQDEPQVTSTPLGREFAAWANVFPAEDAAAESREPGVIAQPVATPEGTETYEDYEETRAEEEHELVLSAEEQALRDRFESGEPAVVINMRTHKSLMEWAKRRGLFQKIDRSSVWGNPFILDEDAPGGEGDGDRGYCVDAFRDFYLPHKPMLLGRLAELDGKFLGCWCHPERCHGDAYVERLKERREEER